MQIYSDEPAPSEIEWSIITVSYNSEAELGRHWAAFRPRSNIEWIVVDNNSTDDSVAVARALGARVIELDANVGFGAANNQGFSEALGDYVAFVNPDVTINLPDLPILQGHLDSHPTDLAAPQLLDRDGSPQPNGRGAPFLTWKILHRLAPSKLDGRYRFFAQPHEALEVVWLTGAVIAGKSERLRFLGPWDDSFFLYYEDLDLGIRNLEAGGRSIVIGDARWCHGWARSTASLNLRAWKLELESMLIFYRRYPAMLVPSRWVIKRHPYMARFTAPKHDSREHHGAHTRGDTDR